MFFFSVVTGVNSVGKKRRKAQKLYFLRTLKADSHIACRAHAVPLPCRAAKGLEYVFPI